MNISRTSRRALMGLTLTLAAGLLGAEPAMSQEGPTLHSADFDLAFALHSEWSAGKAIAVDANGDFYVAGYFVGDMDADLAPDGEVHLLDPDSSGDAFLTKYDAEGSLVWARQMGLGRSRFAVVVISEFVLGRSL